MTLFDLAQRFVGEVRELPGIQQEPFIQWCFTKCGYGPDTPDEIPWCSAILNGWCWLLRLPRSKSSAARSWLTVGQAMSIEQARVGYDIVILRQEKNDPGPDVLKARGHVGLFAGREVSAGGHQYVLVLGGNQADAVSVVRFPEELVLGVRRLSNSV